MKTLIKRKYYFYRRDNGFSNISVCRTDDVDASGRTGRVVTCSSQYGSTYRHDTDPVSRICNSPDVRNCSSICDVRLLYWDMGNVGTTSIHSFRAPATGLLYKDPTSISSIKSQLSRLSVNYNWYATGRTRRVL